MECIRAAIAIVARDKQAAKTRAAAEYLLDRIMSVLEDNFNSEIVFTSQVVYTLTFKRVEEVYKLFSTTLGEEVAKMSKLGRRHFEKLARGSIFDTFVDALYANNNRCPFIITCSKPPFAKVFFYSNKGIACQRYTSLPPTLPSHMCAVCGVTRGVHRCSSCLTTAYCSQDHQAHDWRHHALYCSKVSELDL
jgi:hypothetical protein